MDCPDLTQWPLVVVGAQAWRHWGIDSGADVSDWELWAGPTAPLPEGALIRRGIAATAQPGHGHVAFRWNGLQGDLTVRVWEPGSSGALLIAAHDGGETIDSPAGVATVARPASLLSIDRAALIEPEQWFDRINLFHAHRQRVGDARVSSLEQAAADRRAQEIEAHTAKVHAISMRVPNDAFFGGFKHDDIRLYPHDDLHLATCYYDEPLYLKIKDDPTLAYIPSRNFLRLSHQDRMRLVREECFAIALERVVIPAEALGIASAAEDAYLYAVHRICTDLTTGWFRDFAIDNFPELAQPDIDYVGHFRAAAASGCVRRTRPDPLPDDLGRSMVQHLDRVAQRRALAGLVART